MVASMREKEFINVPTSSCRRALKVSTRCASVTISAVRATALARSHTTKPPAAMRSPVKMTSASNQRRSRWLVAGSRWGKTLA